MKRVLMSVTDKRGLKEFAEGLLKRYPGCELVASGGTAKALEPLPVRAIESITGFPECFGGRVKTLQPKIMGGILYRRGVDDSQARELEIPEFDMVVCNLYDFKGDDIETMDIGGSTLIRAAVKNHASVLVVVDPNDYEWVLQSENTLELRQRLAVKAMNLSADYEAMIAEELGRRLVKEETRRTRMTGGKKLRYGENPDQEGWVYQFPNQKGIAQAEVLAGKELSYNNYEDATAALQAAAAMPGICVAIVKHGNLCGFATGTTLEGAFEDAWAGDTKSAFGSIIAFSQVVGEELKERLKGKFVEVLIAPDFTQGFVEWAKRAKPDLRLLKVVEMSQPDWIYKNISGGMLAQRPKNGKRAEWRVVTRKKLEAKPEILEFAIAAVKFGKSNATALVREKAPGCFQLIGMGSGQPNRVDSLERLAIPKAIENLGSEDLSACVLASDGFFPFDDSIRSAAKFGIVTCVQPGGSKNDAAVIQAADELGVCMVFTGERYFSH